MLFNISILTLAFISTEEALEEAHLHENILAALSIILLCSVVTCILLLWRRNVRFKQLSEHRLQGLNTEQRLRAQLDYAMQHCKLLEEELSMLRNKQEIGTDEEIEKTKYASSSLSTEKQKNLFNELERLMRNEVVFVDPLLSIDKLAQLLNTNRTYLSQVINEMTQDSYSAYVNKFRIDYATILLSDKENKDSLGLIAQKTGFNSASSFYTIFKKTVGVSPKVFRENVNKMDRKTD